MKINKKKRNAILNDLKKEAWFKDLSIDDQNYVVYEEYKRIYPQIDYTMDCLFNIQINKLKNSKLEYLKHNVLNFVFTLNSFVLAKIHLDIYNDYKKELEKLGYDKYNKTKIYLLKQRFFAPIWKLL